MLRFAFTKILWLQSGEWIAGEQGRRQNIVGPGTYYRTSRDG